MISISKLYCGAVEPADDLRYGRAGGLGKPVVVFNCTRRCNLRCRHCYAGASDRNTDGELSGDESLALLDDLAAFGVPVVLFSGGEPLGRADLPALVRRATELGMRAVVSTNGTLIDERLARCLQQAGAAYVGVSLDGMRATNDAFRGMDGAFDAAIAGIRNCRAAGIKVGLRFTIHKHNAEEIDGIFKLARDENISRLCFYHLVYAGRASTLMDEDLDHAATRAAVDEIIDRTAELHRRGLSVEVLTVDNHADGPYLYLRMLRQHSPRAEQVLRLLRTAGGNASGCGIGCVGWDGRVHPDPFWRNVSLGDVRRRSFADIWSDESNPLLAKLRDKGSYVTGRCKRCRFLDVCGGNFRTRAEAATGELWAPDPACYLTDEEIGLGG
ncbi:MAG: radical SAM protein [Planctomycetota bacterium]|nr:radical SAM protein [Planctomycetota bacterium]